MDMITNGFIPAVMFGPPGIMWWRGIRISDTDSAEDHPPELAQ
jgi:hypothetical protein